MLSFGRVFRARPRVPAVPAAQHCWSAPHSTGPGRSFSSQSVTSESSLGRSPAPLHQRSQLHALLSPHEKTLNSIAEIEEAEESIRQGNLTGSVSLLQRANSIIDYSKDPFLITLANLRQATVFNSNGDAQAEASQLHHQLKAMEGLDSEQFTSQSRRLVTGSTLCALSVAQMRAGELVSSRDTLGLIPADDKTAAGSEILLASQIISAWLNLESTPIESGDVHSIPSYSSSLGELFSVAFQTQALQPSDVPLPEGVSVATTETSVDAGPAASAVLGADSVYSLGRIFEFCGDQKQAQHFYETAAQLYTRALVENDDTLVFPFVPIDTCLSRVGGSEAIQESVQFAEDHYGEKHPRLAAALRNFAIFSHKSADAISAEGLYRQSLRLLSNDILPAFKNCSRTKYQAQLTVAAYGALLTQLEWNGQTRASVAEALRKEHQLPPQPTPDEVAALGPYFGWMDENAPELLIGRESTESHTRLVNRSDLDWLSDRYSTLYYFDAI